MSKNNSIATLISYCTNDFKFLKPCIESVKPFSKEIIVSVCDHYFNGEPENAELMEKSRKICEEMGVEFVEFEFDPEYFASKNMQRLTDPFQPNRHYIPINVKAPWFWHQVGRLYAFNSVQDCEYVMFVDVDEIFDTDRFSKWLDEFDYQNYTSMRFECYWYFRESKFRALQTEDGNALTLVKKDALQDEHFFLHDSERHNFMSFPQGNKAAHIVGSDGKPMVHHYSWVRTKEEMLLKCRSWGHVADKNWAELIEKEFSKEFDHRRDKDFVHGYSFNTVRPVHIFEDDGICIAERHDVLNYLVKNYNLKNYLEIGIANGDSQNAVKAVIKDSVDPAANVSVKYKMTSDVFFETVAPTLSYKYDLVFVDGLHVDEQIRRDIDNSLKYLNEGGFVVVHDCMPVFEDEQIVPNNGKLGWWLGDGWKSMLNHRETRKDLYMCVVTTDMGCGIITKGSQELYASNENMYTWNHYINHYNELLNTMSTTEFKKKFKGNQ